MQPPVIVSDMSAKDETRAAGCHVEPNHQLPKVLLVPTSICWSERLPAPQRRTDQRDHDQPAQEHERRGTPPAQFAPGAGAASRRVAVGGCFAFPGEGMDGSR